MADDLEWSYKTVYQLKQMALAKGIKSGLSKLTKAQLIKLLSRDDTKKSKKIGSFSKLRNDGPNTYANIGQLGSPGKEGIVYLVMGQDEKLYAMKTFRKTKSGNTIEREAYFQFLAAQNGIAPKIIEYNPVEKYIVMERLDKTLVELLKEQKNVLTKSQQEKIIELYDSLDEIGIMVDDSNPRNIMIKNDRFYMIDYGFAKYTTDKSYQGYKRPNFTILTIGLLTWVKDTIPTKTWTYIRSQVNPILAKKLELDTWP